MTSPAFSRRLIAGAASVAAAGLLLTACGGSGSGTSSAAAGADGKDASAKTAEVAVTITDAGCAPTPAKVPAGPVKFNVSNKDSGKVTEVELQDSGKMLGEKENLTPGLSGDFSLTLTAGTYQVWCPGAGHARSTFTVSGSSTHSWKDDPKLVAATTGYASWIDGQVKLLVSTTQTFTDDVKAGDLAKAKLDYGRARVHYERVEPTAEIWGDLDGRIDGRVDDAATPAQFTGFHRIEQAIWQKKSLKGMTPLATRLNTDVKSLYTQVKTVEYQPAEIANGATDLVNEIQSSKITGEEERYSHIDLLDFKGNLDGANEAVNVLLPVLKAKDPSLAAEIARRYAATATALAAYAAKPGYLDSGYVDYATVTSAQRRTLSQVVDAYAESVSQVAGKVA
ncbi:imelysin family protein [Streptomyces sp. SL13]|uniref:Imelysin family protein n=1 Tax=Streptantibioticus silvisoli TaxID=2705255 RepID=A0AA90K826_9ACTN|nr:iron uptake system protein EfeO [Streptantibioticus silvisoli]MDI5966216.1 imelysin family protein [Streptantibioticus silvisoli]MDI5968967.1 imelysin family protein [Streptantibioticus silvisoli]